MVLLVQSIKSRPDEPAEKGLQSQHDAAQDAHELLGGR